MKKDHKFSHACITNYENMQSIFVSNLKYIQIILVCWVLKISSRMYHWALMTTEIGLHLYFSPTSCVNLGGLIRFLSLVFPFKREIIMLTLLGWFGHEWGNACRSYRFFHSVSDFFLPCSKAWVYYSLWIKIWIISNITKMLNICYNTHMISHKNYSFCN